jgi:hypothetical protein
MNNLILNASTLPEPLPRMIDTIYQSKGTRNGRGYYHNTGRRS